MEDRARPTDHSHENSGIDAEDGSQNRVARALNAFRGRGDSEHRFWANILSGREQSAEDDEDDDEDNNETGVERDRGRPEASSDGGRERRGRRLGRAFKALFPRPAPRGEQAHDLHERNNDDEPHIEHPFFDFSTLRPRETAEHEEEPTDSGEITDGDRETPTEIIEEVAEDIEAEEPPHQPITPEVAPPVDEEPPTDLPPVHHRYSGGGGAAIPIREAAAPERLGPVRDERLRGAVAGLLLVDLVDYVATKRREKKLEQRVDKKAKASEAQLQHQIDQQRTAQEVVDRRTRGLVEQIEARAPNRAQEMAVVGKVVEQQIQNNPKVEHLLRTQVQAEQEKISLTEPDILSRGQEFVTRSELAQDVGEPTVRPHEILKAVEQAAEKNIAIESMYERRHEARGAEDQKSWSGAQQAGARQKTYLPLGDQTMPTAQQPFTHLPQSQDPHANMPVQKQPHTKFVAGMATIALVIVIIVLAVAVIVTR